MNIFFETLEKLEKIGFYRFTIEGFSRIPAGKRIVFVANHSGWIAADAIIFLFLLRRQFPKISMPAVIAHEALFRLPLFNKLLPLVNAVSSAEFRKIIHGVVKDSGFKSILIFPEGEHGNCKPFWNAYRMRHWKSGFLRFAFQQNALLIPISIVGAEEAFPGLRPFNLINTPLRSIAPFPLGVFPAHFSVKIFKPIDIRKRFERHLFSAQGVATVIRSLQSEHQKRINREAGGRPLFRISTLFQEIKNILIEDTSHRLGLQSSSKK
jgi:1-acyl-sn-glycerol-3-phosphate acyltransferase